MTTPEQMQCERCGRAASGLVGVMSCPECVAHDPAKEWERVARWFICLKIGTCPRGDKATHADCEPHNERCEDCWLDYARTQVASATSTDASGAGEGTLGETTQDHATT